MNRVWIDYANFPAQNVYKKAVLVLAFLLFLKTASAHSWLARVAQFWEHSPFINVQIPASASYFGWVCCWFSPLLPEVFLWVLLLFSSKTNISKFQFNKEWTTKNHFLDFLPLKRYSLFIIIMTPLLPRCSDGWRRVTTKQKVKTTCQVGKTTYKIDIKLFLTRYRSLVQQIGKMHRSIYFNFSIFISK